MSEILYLFHHIHYKNGQDTIHHCGGKHKKIGYTIKHCSCGKHSINKRIAIGHTVNKLLESAGIAVKFTERCPYGGWHIESGTVK